MLHVTLNAILCCSLGSGLSHAEDLREVVQLLTASSTGAGGSGRQQWRAPPALDAVSPSSGVVMLQSSGSFFAYDPILKALQRMELLPLQQYLVPPTVHAATVHPGGYHRMNCSAGHLSDSSFCLPACSRLAPTPPHSSLLNRVGTCLPALQATQQRCSRQPSSAPASMCTTSLCWLMVARWLNWLPSGQPAGSRS